MNKPLWWPRNPYSESIFPMERTRYAEIVPDPDTRTALSGMLGREFFDIASESILAAHQEKIEEIREAIHWLYGFWDGNALIPYCKDWALQEEIQAAFERCLGAVEDCCPADE